jgi:large subunit ribosomal protein L25
MANTIELHPRTPGKSRDARALRRAGQIPGILYGLGKDPTPFAVDVPSLREALTGEGGRHAVFELKIPGRRGSLNAVLKDFQVDPVRDRLIHVDMLEISMTEKLVAAVVVRLEGDAPGVRDGGVLDQPLYELQVEALPADLPAELVVDVSGLEIGGAIKVSDVAAPAGVTIVTDPEASIAIILQATRVEDLEAEAAEGEAVEGEAAEGAEGAESSASAEAGSGDEAE